MSEMLYGILKVLRDSAGTLDDMEMTCPDCARLQTFLGGLLEHLRLAVEDEGGQSRRWVQRRKVIRFRHRRRNRAGRKRS